MTGLQDGSFSKGPKLICAQPIWCEPFATCHAFVKAFRRSIMFVGIVMLTNSWVSGVARFVRLLFLPFNMVLIKVVVGIIHQCCTVCPGSIPYSIPWCLWWWQRRYIICAQRSSGEGSRAHPGPSGGPWGHILYWVVPRNTDDPLYVQKDIK